MGVKFTNNATGTLSAGITNVASSLTLQAGQGSLFPTLGATDYCYLTLVTNDGSFEIVKATARSGDTFTITRGQDNTVARAFSSGDKAELRPVAAALSAMADRDFQDALIGVYFPYAGFTCPAGFIPCDGRAISRTTYAKLYAVIGTVYGSGNGTTTFNVPDLRARTLVCANGPFGSAANTSIINAFGSGNIGGEWYHTLSTGEMPQHSHTVNDPGHSHPATTADAGHSHGVNDPGHTHFYNSPIAAADRATSFGGQFGNAGDNTGSATTGITLSTGYANLTTVISDFQTGIWLSNTGSTQPHLNLQPSYGVNYMIYAGA